MRRLFAQAFRDDSGQDLIEYALLAGFISVVAVTAITNLGLGVNVLFSGENDLVQTIPSGS